MAATNRVTGQPETSTALREVIALAQSTLQDARRAVWDMRPPSLASQELPAALKTAAEDGVHGTGLTLEYEAEGPPRPLDPKVEAVVFRIGQEAIANPVKHAAARTLRVRCTYGARRVRLSVADDGRGFTVDPDFRAYGGHWGLLGMVERASQIGAKVLVGSRPSQGTEVILLAPYAVRERHQPERAQRVDPVSSFNRGHFQASSQGRQRLPTRQSNPPGASNYAGRGTASGMRSA